MKILLVEDEAFMQEAMSSVIERYGIEVFKASNLPDAIKILEQEEINLVITDLYFPQPDGYELIKLVKNNPSTHHLPVIVVTGFETQIRNKPDQIQPDLWLFKPFTLEELRNAIRKFSVEAAA